ncbi:MAG: hypothetical protein QOH56_3537 [Pseudonocardiales bacterium]|nr:hypothetical protein [Pseudonocardiales bacterium]
MYEALCSLVNLGPRFHGSSGEIAAAEYLAGRLADLDAPVSTQEVQTIGWHTEGFPELLVTSPIERQIECWPMLWSAASSGSIEGSLMPLGRQGLWSNAMVWHKFVVVADGAPLAYILARDSGPAAPQPLPSGSAAASPHLAIGYQDGVTLTNWIRDGNQVTVRLMVDTQQGAQSTGNNLYLDLQGREPTADRAIVCGHYDTFWNTPGAYDNGSGTIALLELARRWSAHPPRRPVRLVFFAAEEWHLAGSRTYVANMSDDERASTGFVVNIDGLGRGDLLEYSVGPETLEFDVARQITSFAESSGRSALQLSSRFPPLVGTDDAPFYAAGIPSVHLTFNDFDVLHRPEDVPNRASAANLAWAVPLVERLVDSLEPVDRAPLFDLL